MKKIIVATFITLFFSCSIVKACHYESHYSRKACVTNIQNDLITVEDNRGHIWEFFGDDFEKGDAVKLTFFDNHTRTLADDEIVDAVIIK